MSHLLKFANKLFCRDCGGQLSVDDFKAVPLVCRDALYNNVHCANCTRFCWICDDPTPTTLNKVLNRDISTEEESPLEESGKSHTPPPVSVPLGMEESAQLAILKVFYKTVENELTIVIRKLMSINDKYPDDISLPGAINELQNLRDMCVRYG